MQIEINELAQLIRPLKENKDIHFGFRIVVLTNGFVYCGDASLSGDLLKITNAKNIRVWGTTNGLGELSVSGPTKSTKLDPIGDVEAPLAAVIHLIACKQQF